MSKVENASKSNTQMIDYFNSVAEVAGQGKLSKANGMLSPSGATGVLNNMLGKNATFNQETGTWPYEKGLFQLAENEIKLTLENFDDGKKFKTEKERNSWRTSQDGMNQKASFRNMLNENAIVSFLFDDTGFNDGGYWEATAKQLIEKGVASGLEEWQKNH